MIYILLYFIECFCCLICWKEPVVCLTAGLLQKLEFQIISRIKLKLNTIACILSCGEIHSRVFDGENIFLSVQPTDWSENRETFLSVVVRSDRKNNCYTPGNVFIWINLLKPTGHAMHQQFNIQQLYVLPTPYLCDLYLSENKQRLVPLTA